MKILVVDDDVDFADGMAEMLALFGHEVHTAYACDDSVVVAWGNMDLALIDVGLNGRNGAECAREFRTLNEAVTCVLMTGYSSDALTRMGISIDEFKILRKPVKFEDLAPYLKD